MYYVYGKTIVLTRGDTAIINLSIDGYTPQDGDSIRFALKKEYSDAEPLLVIPISGDPLSFRIEHDDTEELGFGDYVFDIELTRGEDVDTVVPEGTLKLTEEVL